MTRFILLKTNVSESGSLELLGLSQIIKKSSGTVFIWINFAEAKTNCHEPDKCDFVSFEEEDEVVELLEGGEIEGNVAYIGVNA